jgi:hypothetical protein
MKLNCCIQVNYHFIISKFNYFLFHLFEINYFLVSEKKTERFESNISLVIFDYRKQKLI